MVVDKTFRATYPLMKWERISGTCFPEQEGKENHEGYSKKQNHFPEECDRIMQVLCLLSVSKCGFNCTVIACS